MSAWSSSGVSPVDPCDHRLDVDRGLMDIARREAELVGQCSVAVTPFGRDCDARGPRVLGAQPKDLHANIAHAGALLLAHEPIHEDQVDEVTVATVRVFWVGVVGAGMELLCDEVGDRNERQLAGGAQTQVLGVDEGVGRPVDLLPGGSFGGRDLELDGAPRVTLVADLDITAEGGGVANPLEPGQPEGESLPAVSQRCTQMRADLLASQPCGGVEVLRRAPGVPSSSSTATPPLIRNRGTSC